MTAPQEAGGAGPDIWLDMSRYPDTDPDTALTGAEQDLLSSSLAVDDAALPDAVWEHMLAVVTGADEGTDEGTDEGSDSDGTDPDEVDAWAGDGVADPVLDDPDPADDDAGGHVDGAWDDGAWDGGAV